MINIYKENGLTFADLAELHEWEKNPKVVKEQDYLDLKRQIDLGQFKPLLVMEDGTVLGGNTRVKAYREKEIIRPWVSLVQFEQDLDSRQWSALVNEVKAKRTFDSVEQAMLEYSLADNDNKGQYDSQALAELAMPYQYTMPMEIYKVALAYPVKMQSLLDSFQPSATVPDPSSRDEDVDTTDDKLQTYLHGTIRQIVLYFDVPTYEDILKRLDIILKKYKLENNTDVVLKLLKFYEEHQELDTTEIPLDEPKQEVADEISSSDDEVEIKKDLV